MSPALSLADCPDREPANFKTYFSNQDKLEGECLLPFLGGCFIRLSQLFFSRKDVNFFTVVLVTECLKCFKDISCSLTATSLQCTCADTQLMAQDC